MPLSDEALRRYDVLLTTYRTRLASILAGLWDGLDSYDEAGVESFTTSATPALAGAKRNAVAASTAVFALALEVRPPAIRADAVEVVPRIDHPFLATWHALAEGRPYEEAVSAGRSQAQAVGEDFIQQTSRRTGDVVAETTGRRVRWQRVPNGNACEWCLTVAGQSYFSAESADFGHDRCFCMVIPAGGDEVGQVVTRTYERGTGRRATGATSHRTLTEAQRAARSRPNPRWQS